MSEVELELRKNRTALTKILLALMLALAVVVKGRDVSCVLFIPALTT